MPVVQDKQHWAALVFYVPKCEIRYYDSLAEGLDRRSRETESVRRAEGGCS
jgi:Ulp1 family protease